MIKSKQTGNVYFGDAWFKPPFRVMGYWVEDAQGKMVAETSHTAMAKALAELLNKEAK